MFSTWSDSWYGRCRFRSSRCQSISRASSSFDTRRPTAPMPPKLIALVRAPIS